MCSLVLFKSYKGAVAIASSLGERKWLRGSIEGGWESGEGVEESSGGSR